MGSDFEETAREVQEAGEIASKTGEPVMVAAQGDDRIAKARTVMVPKSQLILAQDRIAELEKMHAEVSAELAPAKRERDHAQEIAEGAVLSRLEVQMRNVIAEFVRGEGLVARELEARCAAILRLAEEGGVKLKDKGKGLGLSLLRELQEVHARALAVEEEVAVERANTLVAQRQRSGLEQELFAILDEAGVPRSQHRVGNPAGLAQLVKQGWERLMEDLSLENKALLKDLERMPERGMYRVLRWFMKQHANGKKKNEHDGHREGVKGCMLCVARTFIEAEPPKEKPKKPVKMFVWNWEGKDGATGRLGVIAEGRPQARRTGQKKATLLGIALPYDFDTLMPEEFEIEDGMVFG